MKVSAEGITMVGTVAVMVTIHLPAEHAVVPTGVGRVLGLIEMDEIKAQLAEEVIAPKRIT